MRRLLLALRPGEWVLLGFFGYCGGRLAASGVSGLTSRQLIAFPTADICVAALAFVLLKLGLPKLRALPSRLRTACSIAGVVLFVLTLFSLDAPRGDINLPELARVRWVLLALDALVVILVARGSPRSLLAPLRDWLGPVALLCFYPLIPLVMTGAADRDTTLANIDRFLFFGASPTHLLEHLISGPLSEWMAFCYSLYIAIILVGLGALFLREDGKAFRELSFAMTFVLACGYIGYTLVPAQGPMFTEHFDTDLSLYYLKTVKEMLMDQMRVPRDCFPSLHTAVTFTLANALRRHARPLFLLFSPAVVTMPFACVYLRYHYVTDVLAGILLAGITAWLVESAARAKLLV